ncbi:MAG: cation-translocating P-type ATPase [Deltaproteobacteria bacterium]|nr:cation-translocating P-type ATPase [Deltaproteobacteria bacterium]
MTRRLDEVGRNELVERGGKSRLRILWDQFASTMMVMLIAAAVVSAALADYEDAVAIVSIVILNAILGFSQEVRAERAIAALKRLSVPIVRVRRDGRVVEVAAPELVPGDVVLLEAGSAVPADGRVVESVNLRTQESALTGESEPVDKVIGAIDDEAVGIGDRRNMVFTGTVVAFGRGQIVVTGTGMETELGKIASLIQSAGQDPTPLQKRLDRLGRELAAVALVIVAVVFVLGLLRGESAREMFLTAVSLAVAAVPEGLPAVVTIALALGAQRMLGRRALIRKLPAVETLGSVDVICSDKTGTLTENRMTVYVLHVVGLRFDLPPGSAGGGVAPPLPDHPALPLLLAGAALCNDALLEGESGHVRPVGDPTETALLSAASLLGLDKRELEVILPRVGEVPFDSVRKRMTTIHRVSSVVGGEVAPASSALVAEVGRTLGSAPQVAFTKGAVDGLVELSDRIWTGHGPEPLDATRRARVLEANAELAGRGMRVLGVALRSGESFPDGERVGDAERGLTFLGLVGMIDPPRAEAKAAVATCIAAGIRPIMITGDHPLTALHIAGELGFPGDRAVTGAEVEHASEADLAALVERASVFARVSPEHKLRIVEALAAQGHNVAMTGDGVNDAPALKKADIGVAMGVTGTDVAKEAADMVLLDDNFATIVAAVEEGRVIYDNIRKFIRYLVSTNSAEIGVMLIAPLLGMPLPLLPLQILWINLVTDGPPALALGVEPAERFIMRRPPYDSRESVFARGLGWHAAWVGTLMTATCLGIGYFTWRAGDEHWQTMIFTTLALSQMAHVLAIRSERDSLFQQGLFSNPWALGAVLLTVALQAIVVFVTPLQRVFHTVALAPVDLGWCVGLASVIFVGVEIEKWVKRRSTHKA